MAMLGKVSKQQMSKVMAEKLRRKGKTVQRRGGVMAVGVEEEDDEPDDGEEESKTEEQMQRLSEWMKASTVFGSWSAKRLADIMPHLKEFSCRSRQVVYEQGDPGNCMYIVETGEFSMHVKQAGDKPVKTYTSGAIFGEIAVLYGNPREATIKCKHAGTMWSLSRKRFKEMNVQETQNKTGIAMAAMRSSTLLGGLSAEQLELVASELEVLDRAATPDARTPAH